MDKTTSVQKLILNNVYFYVPCPAGQPTPFCRFFIGLSTLNLYP